MHANAQFRATRRHRLPAAHARGHRLPAARAAAQRGLGVFGLLLALVFASAIGGWLAWNITREPDRPVAELAERWAPAPSRFVPVEGLQVHVREQGPPHDPVPIVLIHGTSASLHTWEGWVRVLATQRRVITFDLPGFGLTGPAADGDYSLAAYARFLGTLLDALNVRRAVVGGNSLGGQIAWYFATVQPQRVERLILVDAAGYPFEPQVWPVAFRAAYLAAQYPALRPIVRESLPRWAVQSSVRAVYGDPSRVTPDIVERYHALASRSGNRDALVRRFEEAAREMGDPALTARIATVRQPTLVLWGGADRLIPPEHAQRFARDIPGARVQVFPKLGHVPQEEDPQATVAPVVEFVRR